MHLTQLFAKRLSLAAKLQVISFKPVA